MNKKTILGLFLSAWFFTAISTQPIFPITIDVRTQQEFNQEHIQGAFLAPHNNIESLIANISTDKNQPIILYCKSGRRAGIAQKKLHSLGYTNVSNAGGLKDLKAQNHLTLPK